MVVSRICGLKGDACGVETFGGSIDLFWNLVNIEAEKGTVHTVIDHLGFLGYAPFS